MNQCMKRATASLLGSLPGSLCWCCLLTRWRYISTHCCKNWAPTFLYFYFHLAWTNLRASFFLSSVWRVRNLWIEEADVHYQGSDLPQPLFTLSASFFLPGWSDSLSLWVLHNTAQTPLLLWSSEKASRSSSLFRSLFSLSFQSRESISCTHTRIHTHDSLLFPSICLFSSQWSFRLDMYCEKLSCSASFFFSFFHSLSLSTVCH